MSNKTHQTVLTIAAIAGLLTLNACHSSVGKHEASTKTPTIIDDTLTNHFEVIAETEMEQINETAALTVKLQNQRYQEPTKEKPILRGVHPKSHGCVKAIFTIDKDIKENLRVGLFSTPRKEYQAWIRFSNAAVRVEHDLKGGQHGSRGMAIKVLEVDGNEKFLLLDDRGARNQDFLMINTPMFAFANVQDYLRLTKVIHANQDDPSKFFAPLNLQIPGFTDEVRARTKRSFEIVKKIKKTPVANPLGVKYFGAAPFLFGPDRVMRFSVVPVGGEQEQIVPSDVSEDYLREALSARMLEENNVIFDFKVQVLTKNDKGLGIEDATTEWDPKDVPFNTVSRITIPAPQDPSKNVEVCEKLFFTPWHALASHQPLGSINRLRKPVYSKSAEHRLGTGYSKSTKGGE